jgi:hypothetical protein
MYKYVKIFKRVFFITEILVHYVLYIIHNRKQKSKAVLIYYKTGFLITTKGRTHGFCLWEELGRLSFLFQGSFTCFFNMYWTKVFSKVVGASSAVLQVRGIPFSYKAGWLSRYSYMIPAAWWTNRGSVLSRKELFFVLLSIEPSVQWVVVALSVGLKKSGREADHSLSYSAKVKNVQEYFFMT